VRLSELDRSAAKRIAGDGGVVVVPIAATEQHGPHLPAGTDSAATEYVVIRAAESLAERVPLAVCPVLPFGCSSHHIPFGATASLSPPVLLTVLLDLGESLVGSGFTKLLIINGHGGNHAVMLAAAGELCDRHGVTVAAASWWQLAERDLVADGALERGDLPGHAGAFETSLMLALEPDLVHDLLPDRDTDRPGRIGLRASLTVRGPDDWTAIEGFTDSPSRADPDAGRRYLERAIASVAAAIERLAKGS
jgi:creatinine amidohydrolase